jgi:hypothetical protein
VLFHYCLDIAPAVFSTNAQWGPSHVRGLGHRLIFFAALSVSLHAQSIDDGVMMPKRTLFAGNVYSHDGWDHYWEGSLNRVNGNLGTVTTQTDTWFGDYGVTNRLNVIVQVPYVWTHASQGVLHDMQGFQDITFAAKYSFLDRPFTQYGSLRAIAVASGAIPLTSYNFDFEPLSIGTGSKRISGRLTLNYQTHPGWFVNGSAAYTFRGNVTLDRPYYFTENQLFLTNVVQMPNVFDYVASGGYHKRGVMAQVFFSQQRTQGGGDIRRQDMPFVSNRVNFSKVGALLMYPLPIPKLRNLTVQFSWAHVVDGRNVGESTTFTTGLLYTLRFHGAPLP